MTETIRVGDITVLRAAPIGATRPPILLVHGYFADASLFERWLPFLAGRGFPVYAVNLRGRAGSRMDVDLGRASIGDFVNDAETVARSIGAPVVVGHSMGGLVAQCLAEHGAVRAAVLVAPAPPRGIMVLTARVALAQTKYLPWILASLVVKPQREDLREIVLNRVPVADQNAMLDRLIPDSGRAARDMSITGIPVDPRKVICPVLVIAAGDDRFIPKRIVERVAERYHVPVVTMVGRGHMLVVEPGWEIVADTVARWIEAL